MEFFGIDLGSSSCLLSKVTKQTESAYSVACVSDENGLTSFPSIAHFQTPDHCIVGQDALPYLYQDPESTIELIKLHLGRTDNLHLRIADKNYIKTPQEISSHLLTHLKKVHSTSFEKAVVTVPAFFDQSQKEAIMQACLIAGVEPIHLLEEPTAAIIYHVFEQYQTTGMNLFKNKPTRTFLVFDFGGGTLDLSLIKLQLENNAIKPIVLAVGGDPELGGSLIDLIFTKAIIDNLYSTYPEDVFLQQVHQHFQKYYKSHLYENKAQWDTTAPTNVIAFIIKLKQELEQVKQTLSTEFLANIHISENYDDIAITRDAFEDIILSDEDLNLADRIETALSYISKKRIPLDEILLVGGSTQIPYVRNIIANILVEMRVPSGSITLSEDFNQAVSKGAAIQSGLLQGCCIPPFMSNTCESVVARDIEIEHAGFHNILVSAGTHYPFSDKICFQMNVNHSLSKSIGLSLKELIEANGVIIEKREICNLQFHLPIFYTNDSLQLLMNINAAGLYQLEIIHEKMGESIEFESEKTGALDAKSLEKAISTRKNADTYQ